MAYDDTIEHACPAYVGGCGYPLCIFYSKESPALECPFPIQGNPCQGLQVLQEKEDGL